MISRKIIRRGFLSLHRGFFDAYNQSLTWAYTGRQGRLFVAYHINHQLYAKPEACNEHIPL